PSSAPGAPTIGQSSPGNASATAVFMPPAFDGGSPITSYTATATDLTHPANGGQTQSGPASPITVTGLTNGDSYTVSVTATNAVGSGTSSALSNAVTPSIAAGTPYTFVANESDDSITEFAIGATGDQLPVATISGPATGLNHPVAVALSSSGELFVGSYQGNSVTEYAQGASGNVAPIATISGPATGLSNPAGDGVDASGNLLVADQGTSSITEYAAGATGNATPIALIQGSSTRLGQPQGMAIDSAGDVFVANFQTSSVTEYASGATGNTTPLAMIQGSSTGLDQPGGVVVDSTGHLFVSNVDDSVTEYAAAASGNATPIATIQGPRTGLDGPVGLALDPATGELVVPNFVDDSVTAYATGAAGDQTPAATISGANTGLSQPEGVTVAVAPPPTAPSAPTIGQVTPGDARVTVTFAPPGSDGGSAVNGYTVTASPGGQSATGPSSPITVTGLTDGASYTFTVTATNSAGTGPSSSPSHAVTPGAAPAIGTTALPALADLAISFAHPRRFVTHHHGRYRITISNDGTAATTGVTTVSTRLPRGLRPTGGRGTGWTCRHRGRSESCTHPAPIPAEHTSTLILSVHITAPAGQLRTTIASVAPSDLTPADNTATSQVRVRGR
ncbi:MAG TPA: fibronectin type III domain-containing protein, partial [Acidimicrobiales bacterium]